MASFRKIARRTFLIGSTTIAGGVAFGTYKVSKPPKNPLLPDAPDGEVALNPWIKIDGNGITLITPHIDIGQGSKNMQVMLICEELDADPDQVNTDQGQPAQAYWNSALAFEAAEFLTGQGEGKLYDGAVKAVRLGMRAGGMQITGGSTSTPDCYERLRAAGASARETLKAVAAKKAGMDASALKTERGAVILPDGSQMLYTELAQDAAKAKVIKDVPLRDPSQWRLIGKDVERIDIRDKSTGAPIYGIDVEVDGMVYAAVKRNPYKGGALVSMDASAAKSMRGVIDVLEISGGYAVVADNSWRAMQAVEAVVPQWGASDAYPAEQDAHWEKVAQAFTGDDYNSRKLDEGDVEAALEGGAFEAEYRAPYLVHGTLEPLNAVVLINDDHAELWVGTQAPAMSQSAVAEVAGIDAEKVRIHVPYAGGGFGLRSTSDIEHQAAEIAVQMKGTPVKLTLSREEDFSQSPTRQIAMARLRGKASAEGIDTLDLSIAMPNVTVANSDIPDFNCVAAAWTEPFAMPNRRVTGYAAKGLAPVHFWRSVGASTNGFFYNSAFDELCVEGGLDPLEERLRLCDDEVARKVLEAVGEMSGWDGREMGAGRGRGLAFSYSFGVHTAEVVEVSQTEQGIKIDKAYVALDVGRVVDPVNFENQVQGGVVWGLGHAINCETTYSAGAVEQRNYYDFEAMRLYQCPEIAVRALENSPHVHGVGEPPVPPAPAALANAIFALTGTRLREMPFNKFVDFV